MVTFFLYYIAEDDVRSCDGEANESQDDVYEKFYEENGLYPYRILGVTSNNGKGCIEAQVVWEADVSDNEDEDYC